MEIINFLGDLLADHINISPPAGRGLIRLAIKDEVGPFKPLKQLNYDDLKATIQNSLKKRLIKLEISNYEDILNFILNELKTNQSLITMAGV